MVVLNNNNIVNNLLLLNSASSGSVSGVDVGCMVVIGFLLFSVCMLLFCTYFAFKEMG